jgi:hypothetical protein
MPPITPGSWTCCPQTHRGGGHCRWHVTQVAGGVSPSASPWTCTAAGVTAGGSVSFLYIFFLHFMSPHPTPPSAFSLLFASYSSFFPYGDVPKMLYILQVRCLSHVCLYKTDHKPYTNRYQTRLRATFILLYFKCILLALS